MQCDYIQFTIWKKNYLVNRNEIRLGQVEVSQFIIPTSVMIHNKHSTTDWMIRIISKLI